MDLKSLRDKRSRLMREADACKGTDGKFPDDAARATFDAKMSEVEDCDREIRAVESSASQYVDERGGNRLALAAEAETANEPNERDLGADAERERVTGIIAACRAARLPHSYADKLIADKVPLLRAQSQVFDELRKRDDPAGPNPGARGRVEVTGDDPLVHERRGIENALLHRIAPQHFKLEDHGRQYRGLGLMDIGEIFLRAAGVRITQMRPLDRAAAMLGMTRGMHSTSDFPMLLEDVANKVLRAAYGEAPATWMPLAKPVTLRDFKPSRQLQIGDAPQLLEVGESGEFTSGTIGEGKELLRVKTYGRIFSITRQALINDDTNAFSEVPTSFGRSARTLESNLAWAEITANGDMGDGNPLFDSANHANIDDSGSVISVESIGAGRASMRLQTGIDGVTLLNLSPAYLIVPAALETKADQFVSAVLNPAAAGNVNPFAGRLQVIAEPRLDADNPLSWYLATPMAQCPVLYYGTLDGQGGPVVTQELGFEVDGLKLKCRHDVGFKAADWRGIYKNVGAEES